MFPNIPFPSLSQMSLTNKTISWIRRKLSLQWRHMNGMASQVTCNLTVSFQASGKQNTKARITCPVLWEPPLIVVFPTQRVSNAENVSMSWRLQISATHTLTQWQASTHSTTLRRFSVKMLFMSSQIAKFMGPSWGPPGSCRPQMGPMLAPLTVTHLLSIERADWSKQPDVFKARDAKIWQREFPVGFPV